MARRYDTVTFLTDYGTVDEFAGVVRCVIRDIAPHAVVVDLTHDIAPFDVRGGSLALARSISYVPSGVVLAIVDPGVGTARRAIAIEVGDGEGVIVGPDNGLLAPAVAMAGGATRAVELTNVEFQLQPIGATFAGRDIFAPAAAYLCNGVDLYDLGESVSPDALLPGVVPLPRTDGTAVVAEVLWVDRFGNCQLNVGPAEIAELGSPLKITVGELNGQTTVRTARSVSTFGELGRGALGALVDANGMIALCLDQASAALELQIGPSDQVVLERLDDDAAATPSGISQPVTIRRA